MITRMVIGETVIARVIDQFNISTSDWVTRSPKWMVEALEKIKVIPNLPIIKKELTAVNYVIELPCDASNLKAVTINGVRINNTENIERLPNSKNKDFSNGVTYTILRNNYIRIESNDSIMEDITVIIYYRGFVSKLSKIYNIEMPLIPEDEELEEAIAFYILLRLLMRGYKHPIYSLSSNSAITNPHIIFYGINNRGGLKQKARNSVKSMSEDEYKRAVGYGKSIVIPSRWGTVEYDNTLL